MSTKFASPLLGYNNNVRHKGKVFHIQTEDSGAKYGHIITHLFMDGGRILKSVKTSYAEYIGNERMADIVREMMKQQHKAMFIALRDGKFDAIAEGGADASQATRAIVVDSPPAAAPKPAPAAAAAPTPLDVAPAPLAAPAPAPGPRPRAPALPSAFAAPPPSALPTPTAPDALDSEEGPATIRQPDRQAPGELTLDMDALERAASASAAAPPLRQASELPPPPANLFRDRGSIGKYRITPVPPLTQAATGAPRAPTPAPSAVSAKSAKPGQSAPSPGPARKPAPSTPAAGERRYAPTRPAAIFGQPRPQPSKSAFGDDLISDKSLDEVILSYLAEDLDDKKKK